MRVAEAAATYKEASKEGDEAGEALFGETEDEAEDNAGSDESLLRWLQPEGSSGGLTWTRAAATYRVLLFLIFCVARPRWQRGGASAEQAMPLSRCRRAAPQRSGGNPPPCCR